MSRVYYNKLVRDNIPAIIKSKGESYEIRSVIDQQEFQQELLKKIKEEASALSMTRSRTEFLSEYTDLAIVLESIIQQLVISPEEIETARTENLLRKGGYSEQQFLIWSEDKNYQSNESPQGIH